MPFLQSLSQMIFLNFAAIKTPKQGIIVCVKGFWIVDLVFH